MRRLRRIAWGLVVLLAIAAGAATLQRSFFAERSAPPVAAMPSLGGAFTMRDQAGVPVSEKDLRGRPTLMFFGFTQCPDVCPTTL
jgi:protein SCO1